MPSSLTPEITIMLTILALAIFIFASEIIRVDVGAVLIMILLGLLSFIPGLTPPIDNNNLFDGFSSNAVMALIGIMIIGKALDKTGALFKIEQQIIRLGRKSERAIISLTGSTAGIISSFMQNTGVITLYIPIISRISAHTKIPLSRLLMPLAFCTIVGGTTTMIGSSPLILLNDLLPKETMRFSLFEVTPIGLALLLAGLIYFTIANKWIIPKATHKKKVSTTQYLKKVYGLEAELYEATVPTNSAITGKSIEHLEAENPVRIIAAQIRGENRVAPARDVEIESNSVVVILGGEQSVKSFTEKYNLFLLSDLEVFAEELIHTKAGVSEVVIPPNSSLIGKTVADIWMRKTYGLSVINIYRGENNFFNDVRDIPLQAGDTLVCHSDWQNLAHLLDNRDFIIITRDFPHEELRPQKVQHALVVLMLTAFLVLFTDLKISIALISGALGMILFGVIKMDEAYSAISWKTVFLLASLIPFGVAVENSGTASWIANIILDKLNNVPLWVLQSTIALLTTFFSLMISNVGATVLLVPLAVNIAIASGYDPRMFALIVAISASNAFIIPTNQVNALIMSPGGYSTRDFLKAGIPMTIIFLVIMLIMVNIMF